MLCIINIEHTCLVIKRIADYVITVVNLQWQNRKTRLNNVYYLNSNPKYKNKNITAKTRKIHKHIIGHFCFCTFCVCWKALMKSLILIGIIMDNPSKWKQTIYIYTLRPDERLAEVLAGFSFHHAQFVKEGTSW